MTNKIFKSYYTFKHLTAESRFFDERELSLFVRILPFKYIPV